MDVIGEDGMVYEVEGDVLGAEDEDEDVVVGYHDDGSPIIVGAKKRRIKTPKRRALVSVAKPKWRDSQLAPGVIAPDQGLLPLPLTGNPSNTFSLAVQSITFEGQVQKPFRGERLLVSVVRTGVSATGLLLGTIYVGTDLQQLDVTAFDLEQVGDPNAFGVRMAFKPCQPGVFIRIVTNLSNAITTTDSILCSVTILGRNIH